jgi:hypothetical protein
MIAPAEGANNAVACCVTKRRFWAEYSAVFFAALVVYVATAAPGVLWQDSGMAQIRVLRWDLHGDLGLALSHPLYYLVAEAFQFLPLSESAYKTNLVAVFFGAVTIANVYLLLLLGTKRRFGAALGALTLLVAHTFWQHCAIAEVYTVSTTLLTVELLCFQQFVATGRTRWLAWLFLANGLDISNHMVAALSLACYALWCGRLLMQRRLRVTTLVWCGVVWLAGASIYLALIFRDILGGMPPLDALVSACMGGYGKYVLNVRFTPRLLVNSALYIGMNYPTPLILAFIPGCLAVWKLDPARRFVLLGLLAIHTIWAARYNVPDQYTFFIPTIVLLAIFIGFGCARLTEKPAAGRRAALLAAALLPPIVYFFLPAVAQKAGLDMGLKREIPFRDGYRYFLLPWKTGYDGPQRFAEDVQTRLPKDAVLFADGTAVRPLHYFALTGRWRADIRVYPPLDDTPANLDAFAEERLTDALAAGRVFVITPQPGYCPQWLLDGYEMKKIGYLYQIVGRRSTEAKPEGKS